MSPGNLMNYLTRDCNIRATQNALNMHWKIDVNVHVCGLDAGCLHDVTFRLHKWARTTLDIVKGFDIDIKRLRMTWTMGDGHRFRLLPNLASAIRSKKMIVTISRYYRNDIRTEQYTRCREAVMHRYGYTTAHYNYEYYYTHIVEAQPGIQWPGIAE
jgi:hypothetical protein